MAGSSICTGSELASKPSEPTMAVMSLDFWSVSWSGTPSEAAITRSSSSDFS